jgi:cell division transport system ATP-binding protein
MSLRQVSKSYGPDRHVLRSVSFDLAVGEFIYITGASGAGKSTLLKLLYRAEAPDSGEVVFCGRDLSRLSRESVPYLRRNIGVVFQDFRLLVDQTAFENTALALEVLGMRPRELRKRVEYVLDRVGLGEQAHEPVRNLSGGEQQRVAVARAVVAEPAMVLADEPTGNLDSLRAAEVLSLLDAVNRRGTAVIVATHDHMLMAARPRRTIGLSGGTALDFPREQAHEALELAELQAMQDYRKRRTQRALGPTNGAEARGHDGSWSSDRSVDARG